MAYTFNVKYPSNFQVILSNKWMEYMSTSSMYWDSKFIHELYYGIMAIMAR
jgi:hypothetical protein